MWKNFFRVLFHREHLIISGGAILLLLFCYFVSLNISFLSPVARAIKDFSMSDLYYQMCWSDEEVEESELVTLVDITKQHTRGELASTVEQVNRCNPRTVVLDVIFEGVKDDLAGNDSLVSALSANPSTTVVAAKLIDYQDSLQSFRGKVSSFFMDEFPLMEGYSNVMSNHTASTVREMSVNRKLRGEPGYSLAARSYMVALGDSVQAFPGFSEDRLINFKPLRFPVVSSDSILQHRDLIQNRIVLIGALKEEADMHYTPIGKMPGPEVQAFSVQTLLDQRDIQVVPDWLLMLLAFLACYITQILQYAVGVFIGRRTDTLSVFLSGSFLFLRFVTFSWLALLAFLGFVLYFRFNVYLAMTWIFAPVMLVAEARAIYAAIVKSMCYNHSQVKWLEKSLYKVSKPES